MTVDYLTAALAFVPQCDKSDISDQRADDEGLLSHRSLMSQEQEDTDRPCVTCGHALETRKPPRTEECCVCTADRISRTVPGAIIEEMRLQRQSLEAGTRKANPVLAVRLWGLARTANPVNRGEWF